MQDRFKFRYFYDGAIYDVFAVDFMNKTAQLVSLDRKETLFKGIDTAKLIQCTGLKDKNGRLIYEGDIIFNSCLGLRNQLSWDYEAAAFMFKEIRNRKGFGCTGSMYAILQQYGKYCEIIGNIHENPELLEDER